MSCATEGPVDLRVALRAPVDRGANDVDCTVVIVTYNSGLHIIDLLDSLPLATQGISTRCIVVDNDSQDDTVALVRARSEVTCIRAGGNLGYAGALNIGRHLAAGSSTIAILNPDLILEPLAISILHEALSDPNVGIAVPTLLNESGTLYHSLRREPSVTRALGDAVFGSRWPGRPSWLSEIVRSSTTYTRGHDIEWSGGAVLVVSNACNRSVGAWDDGRFFLYSEETDYARRARAAGYRIHFVPEAQVRHVDGGSGRSAALLTLMTVNRLRYFEKWHRPSSAALFRLIIALHALLRLRNTDYQLALRTILRRESWSHLPGPISRTEPSAC